MFEIEIVFDHSLSLDEVSAVIRAVETAGGMIGGGDAEYVIAADTAGDMFAACAVAGKM